MTEERNIQEKERKKDGKSFWVAFWSVFLGTTIFMFLIFLVYEILYPQKISVFNTKQLIPFSRSKVIKQLAERNAEIIAKAKIRSVPMIREIKENNELQVRNYTSQKLNIFYQQVENENVERFLDWMYSVFTDYQLIYHMGKDILSYGKTAFKCGSGDKKNCAEELKRVFTSGSSTEKFLQSKIEEHLLNKEQFAEFISSQIVPFWITKAQEFKDQTMEIFLKNYHGELANEARSLNISLSDDEIMTIIDNFLHEQGKVFEHGLTLKPIYHVTGSAFTIGAIKIILKKIGAKIAGKIATKTLSKVSTKIAVKGASKIAGAGTTAAVGIGICSPGGPLAVLCGALGGLLGFLGVDYAITWIDELINRQEMKEEIINGLEESKKEMLEVLMKVYDEKFIYPMFGKFLLNQDINLKDLAR